MATVIPRYSSPTYPFDYRLDSPCVQEGEKDSAEF